MIEKLQHKYALSKQGAKDMIKGFVPVTISDLVLMFPVSLLIVGCSNKVQKGLSKKQMKLKMACADGIQECLETVRDLRANNAQKEYMDGLEGKIRAVEKHAVVTELGTAVFVGSAQMILSLASQR